MSDGLSSGGRANIEAQKQLFEKMYRESKIKRSPTANQQKLNTAYKKPSAPQTNYTTPRGSAAVKAQSKARAVRSKYKGQFSRFGKQVKGAAQQGRVSAAKNISKFNGGVRAKVGGTIARVAPAATALGVKTKTLGATISSSKFVAGAKGGPIALLAVGAGAIWWQNIKTLAGIYGVDLPNPAKYLPGYESPVKQESVEGINGGQTPGVQYRVDFEYKGYYDGNPRVQATGYQLIWGEIENIAYELVDRGSYTSAQIAIYGRNKDGVKVRNATTIGNAFWTGELLGYQITRVDGLPDETYQDPTANTTIINNYNYYPPANTPKPEANQPSLKVKVEKPKATSQQEVEANPKTSPLPSVIPIPVILPTDNTTVKPRTPFDAPRTIDKSNLPPATKKSKPSIDKSTKRTYRVPYDVDEVTRERIAEIDKEAFEKMQEIRDRNRQRREEAASDGSFFKLGKTFNERFEDNIFSDSTVEVRSNFPPNARRVTTELVPETTEEGDSKTPSVYFPRLIQAKPTKPSSPKATPTNPCKRGCGGASGGTSFAPGSTSATNIAGVMNDLLLQNPLLKKIDATTTATKGVVSNGTFGLEAAYNFTKKAWEFTRADKIINGLTLFTSLHNAAMLGTNAAQSLGDTATAGLQLFNIKGFDGQPIDVNAAIGTQIKSLLTSVFGASNLNAASENWKKLNRIFQSASAVVNSIQGTKNALLEADEITGGNVAKLANALLTEGQVEADAFDFMNENPDYQTQFGGILGKINAIDEIGDRVSSIVSSGLEIKENVNELKTNSEELEKATDDFRRQKQTEEDAKDAASNSPTIDRLDLLKKEPEN